MAVVSGELSPAVTATECRMSLGLRILSAIVLLAAALGVKLSIDSATALASNPPTRS